MHHRIRLAQLLSLAILAFATAAYAQEAAPAPADSSTGATPAPSDATAAAPGGEAGAAGEETPVVATTAAKPPVLSHYGVAYRWRWISIPGWFLGLFAEKNVPLSSFSIGNSGLEGFWRKHDKDDPNRTWEIVVSFGHQNMSPPDGYWLGRGKNPALDADLVQVRNLALWTMDASYVIRQYFSPYFGIHYGAGLGLGVVSGKVLRTSATYNPTTGQYSVVSQGIQICDANAKCDEKALKATENQNDQGPSDPHRFEETSVPGALPILNILVGIDGRIPIPNAGAVEVRLEGGFYDAFFIGLGVGYAL